MKQMSKKGFEVMKLKAWDAPLANSTARVMCKEAIASRLKAPSTADWGDGESARWKDHPGYFLVTHTVDAENSFGAKLRSSYQCQVVCLAEEVCEVEKLYPVGR